MITDTTTKLRRSIHFDFNTTEWRGGLIASGILPHLVPLPLVEGATHFAPDLSARAPAAAPLRAG